MNLLSEIKLLSFSNVKPFHNDHYLKNSILGYIDNYGISQFIETGTFRADSIIWLAQNRPNLNIRSCEKSTFFYNYAKQKCRHLENISIYHNDSRDFLRTILRFNELHFNQTEALIEKASLKLFWIDSHWDKDFPLLEELKIIFELQRKAIILIDDFQVPEKPNFGFDSYDGKVISYDLIKNTLPPNAGIEFPTYDLQTRGYCTIYYGLG